MAEPDFLTTAEAGALLGVSPPTVISWVKRGELLAHTTPGGHRRIARAALLAFAATRGLRLPTAPSAAPEPARTAPVLIWDAERDYAETVAEYLLLRFDLTAVVAADLIEFAFFLGGHQPSAAVVGWGLLEPTQLARLRRLRSAGGAWIACLGIADPELAARALRVGYDRCAHRGLPMDALSEIIRG